MNMPLSVSQQAKLFPGKVDNVPIRFINKKVDEFYIPSKGKCVVIYADQGILTGGDFGEYIGTADFYVITAYSDAREYYSTALRMTRWISGNPRWRIYHRLSAKIRKATKYLR